MDIISFRQKVAGLTSVYIYFRGRMYIQANTADILYDNEMITINGTVYSLAEIRAVSESEIVWV